MAAAMAAASGGSYLSVLPASTSAIPFLSPQNAVQLAQAKQGTSYGFHHRRAQGEGCDCSVLSASASSFSFSTVFDSNSRKLRMHQKPKCKWLHDREGIAVEARIEEFSSDDFEVERLLGSYGYINVSSYTPPQPGSIFGRNLAENAPSGFDRGDLTRISGQEVEEGSVQTRLYSGRIRSGDRMGTRVLLKAYPAMTTRGTDADVMAANELRSHVILQDASQGKCSENIIYLYGGFQTRAGEQWLVFRDDGRITAADYAKEAAQATAEGRAVGEWEFWDRFDKSRPIQRRRHFITKLLRGTFKGLAFMHACGRLHQSLGPASVVINTKEERCVGYLMPQLRDLAFSTDARDSTLDRTVSALSEGLWRRAAMAGARMAMERKAFGIADDIYAGGLFLAYMVFVPFCEMGSIDGPSLQKLLETTFQLDISAAREYCEADDRWVEAVRFLDLDDGAGWQLLQAMLNPDYRQRPTVEAVLSHRFLTGAVLE
ncbi:unnamed protein product [Sphagnum jensenii]|uniref:Protein kinase domain-containing protein n=1 Tax=Sphagnum jensenii TaxID=128206 RepID=A0ABP1B2F4_9BRYO